MDYNSLKSLSKDVLIKIMFEVEEKIKNERREWFEKNLSEQDLGFCFNKNCFKIQYPNCEDFNWCEECDFQLCNECSKNSLVKIKQCGCGVILCSNCKCDCE